MTSKALNEFGKKIFLPTLKEERNTVVSPLSIFTALGMVSFGANGTIDLVECYCNINEI